MVGKIAELWRYPVKGLLGERVPSLEIDGRGVIGDRGYAVVGADGKFGSAKTTRRFRRMPNLLSMGATTAEGAVMVRFPDGSRRAVSAPDASSLVSDVVGENVTLDLETVTPHHDAGPVHLLTTSSLAWLQAEVPGVRVDRRRFRPNLLLATAEDGRVEEGWIGRELTIGDVRLKVERKVVRCVTIALAQEELPSAPDLPGRLESLNDLCLGVYVSVVSGGQVTTQDAVYVV